MFAGWVASPAVKKLGSTGTATGIHSSVVDTGSSPFVSLNPRALVCASSARSSRTSSEEREPRTRKRRTFQARGSMSKVDASASAPHGASCAHIVRSPCASRRARSLTQSHCRGVQGGVVVG